MSHVTAAMVMGAGLGSRMRPLTDDRPKTLVTVGDKTLMDHSLDRLVAAGVTLAVVNVHYKAQMLRDHLAKRRDIEIVISDETDQLLDTGGGVVKALPHFKGQPFFVLNSDSIWVGGDTPALSAMQALWDESRMDGLLLLAQMTTAIGYDGRGDFVKLTDGRVARARDALKGGHNEPAYGYLGTQIVHPRLFYGAPDGPFSTNVMWDRAIAQDRLFGTLLDGTWLHVGTPQARDEAEAFLRAFA
jgi:MurNAc alpha-1-phosphate uridylyltransferase